jgi:hypothetical protein
VTWEKAFFERNPAGESGSQKTSGPAEAEPEATFQERTRLRGSRTAGLEDAAALHTLVVAALVATRTRATIHAFTTTVADVTALGSLIFAGGGLARWRRVALEGRFETAHLAGRTRSAVDDATAAVADLAALGSLHRAILRRAGLTGSAAVR